MSGTWLSHKRAALLSGEHHTRADGLTDTFLVARIGNWTNSALESYRLQYVVAILFAKLVIDLSLEISHYRQGY